MYTSKGRLFSWLGVSAPFDPSHTLVTSSVLPPFVLALIRSLFAIYALVFILFRLIYEGIKYHSNDSFFAYFTTLSYIGLLAYFWASGVQSIAYVLSGSKQFPLQRWPFTFQFLHLLLFSTITTFPIIVTVVYWALLSSSSTFASRYSSWTNISGHAMNAAFALFEITCTNVGPTPWSHLPFLIILLGCYLGVAYITYDTQGFYTYSFLNPQKQGGLLAAYIVGIGAGECIVFIIIRYIIVLRNWLSRRSSGKGSITYNDLPVEPIDDWEEVQRPKEHSIETI